MIMITIIARRRRQITIIIVIIIILLLCLLILNMCTINSCLRARAAPAWAAAPRAPRGRKHIDLSLSLYMYISLSLSIYLSLSLYIYIYTCIHVYLYIYIIYIYIYIYIYISGRESRRVARSTRRPFFAIRVDARGDGRGTEQYVSRYFSYMDARSSLEFRVQGLGFRGTRGESPQKTMQPQQRGMDNPEVSGNRSFIRDFPL